MDGHLQVDVVDFEFGLHLNETNIIDVPRHLEPYKRI